MMPFAPSLSAGGVDGHTYRRAAALLKERPNTVVADPVVGRSVAAGEPNTGPPASFPELPALVHAQLEPPGGGRYGTSVSRTPLDKVGLG